MIDSHCHLEYLGEDVVREAQQKMSAVVGSTADPKHKDQLMQLRERFPNFVHICYGFHPEVMVKYSQNDIEKYIEFIRNNHDKISAIGEVGLDFNWITNKAEQDASRRIFIKFIELAQELGLPLVIHSRNGKTENEDAITEAIAMLIANDMKDVMLHCFSGNEVNLRMALEQGWYISFATLVCKSEKHQRLAKLVPLEQMLLETDAPWLDPDSKELVNRPWKIERSAEVIAQLKNTTKENILQATEENAKRFFNIQ